MRKLSIPCDFRGEMVPFSLYVGNPSPKHHPMQFQAYWLSDRRGGSIPQPVMDALEHLHQIALEENYSFEELVVTALEADLLTAKEENDAARRALLREKVIGLSLAKELTQEKDRKNYWQPSPTIYDDFTSVTNYDTSGKDASLFKLATKLFTEFNDRMAEVAMAFFAFGSYLSSPVENGNVTLPHIYDAVSKGDTDYSFHVALDVSGEDIPRHAFDLLAALMVDEKHLRHMTSRIVERLIGFCMENVNSLSDFSLVRYQKDLRMHLGLVDFQ